MFASDVMSHDPVTIDENTTVRETIGLLSALGARHLPVTREGRLVGMISDRDVRQLTTPISWNQHVIADGNTELLDQPVTSVMSGGTISIPPDMPVALVIDAICDHRVGAIPVVDDAGKIIGIVSYIDLLRALRPKD